MSTTTQNTCSIAYPCILCADQLKNFPPRPISSLSARNNKPRPAPMSLPQIEAPDPNDLVAIKRMNNTMAARKSRQRQIDNLERLERNSKLLAAERNHWKYWAEWVQERWLELIPNRNVMPTLDVPQWVAFDNAPMDPLDELGDVARYEVPRNCP